MIKPPALWLHAENSLRGLTLAEGILLLLLGMLALIFPLVASVWVTVLAAMVFLIGGLVGWVNILTRAFRLRRSVTFWQLVVATLLLVTGLWMAHQMASGPLTAAMQVAGLSLAIGLVLLLEGVVATIVALSQRQVRGWGLANGMVTVVLGTLILTIKPITLLSVLGLLVGLGFSFSGIDRLNFSASFQRHRSAGADHHGELQGPETEGTYSG